MRFQEDDQKSQKPPKLVKKKASRHMDLQRPTTATTIPISAQPELPASEFVYDVTIVGAGPAGLALA
jgi:NADPH-dependent 2,4-dienoyl-CoA reductase/sulfur reductase-like enzyme